jgi:hypothetical protein
MSGLHVITGDQFMRLIDWRHSGESSMTNFFGLGGNGDY